MQKLMIQNFEEVNYDYLYHCKNDKTLFLYYEVEVNYLHDLSELVIGYVDYSQVETIEENLRPGFYDYSIGFNVKNG